LVVLAVLATGAVAAGAYFGTRGWAAYQEEQQAQTYQQSLEQATAAAENAALAVLAYDHESLEADRDAAAKFLTDDYRPEYVETFDTLVAPTASETKATVEATVLASAAMTAGSRERPDQIPVLLFVNQATTSSTTSGQPRVALNRVRFDMVRVDGTWLVDAITSY
jgi:Mce-associated membrane protein